MLWHGVDGRRLSAGRRERELVELRRVRHLQRGLRVRRSILPWRLGTRLTPESAPRRASVGFEMRNGKVVPVIGVGPRETLANELDSKVALIRKANITDHTTVPDLAIYDLCIRDRHSNGLPTNKSLCGLSCNDVARLAEFGTVDSAEADPNVGTARH